MPMEIRDVPADTKEVKASEIPQRGQLELPDDSGERNYQEDLPDDSGEMNYQEDLLDDSGALNQASDATPTNFLEGNTTGIDSSNIIDKQCSVIEKVEKDRKSVV